jgi:hypothetical protein
MLFSEAMNELVNGNYVTRESWTDTSFLVLLPGIPAPWRVVTVPNPAAGNWQGLREDYLADDWTLLVTAAKKIEEDAEEDNEDDEAA